MGEILEWGVVAVAGWRFLLSPSYRRAKIDDWKSENVLYIVWDIIAGMVGIAISLLALYFAYETIVNGPA